MKRIQIACVAALLTACGSDSLQSSDGEHVARGVVEAFDPVERTLTIAHEAVPSARLAPTTTDFAVADQAEVETLVRRQAVEFTFTLVNGRPVITEIRPAERRTAAAG